MRLAAEETRFATPAWNHGGPFRSWHSGSVRPGCNRGVRRRDISHYGNLAANDSNGIGRSTARHAHGTIANFR